MKKGLGLVFLMAVLIGCSSGVKNYGPLQPGEVKDVVGGEKAVKENKITYVEKMPYSHSSKIDVVRLLGAPNFSISVNEIDYLHYCGKRSSCLELETRLRAANDIAQRAECIREHSHIADHCVVEPSHGFIAIYPMSKEAQKRLTSGYEKFIVPWRMPTNLEGALVY